MRIQFLTQENKWRIARRWVVNRTTQVVSEPRSSRNTGMKRNLFARQISRLGVAFLLACLLAPASALADKAVDDFNLGVGLYRSQRYELAVETFDQFLKEFPEHPRVNLARLYFALSLDSLEKYAPAREQFALFLQAEPDGQNSAEAYYRIGECSYYPRDYPAAIEQLSVYLDKYPQHSRGDWAKLFLGESYMASEQWLKAESILNPLVKSSTTNPSVLSDAELSLGIAKEGLRTDSRSPAALQTDRGRKRSDCSSACNDADRGDSVCCGTVQRSGSDLR